MQLASLALNATRLSEDWQVLQTFPLAAGLFPFHIYAVLVYGLRCLAIALFWLVALTIFVSAGRRQNPNAGMAIFTSALLVVFPAIFAGSAMGESAVESPWSDLLALAGQVLPVLALVFFIVFYYVFPDGRFYPRWMRWVVLLAGLAFLIPFIVLLGGNTDAEWAWPASMLALLVNLLIGLGSQFYRYYRGSDALQKSQVKPVLAALVLIPGFFLLSSFVSAAAWAGISNLLGTLVAPALLPLTLLWALFRHRLWGNDASPGLGRGLSALAAGLLLAWLAGLVVVSRINAPASAKAISFEPLPASDHPRPVIVDTDMAPDDWMAILFLLQRPDIDVRAITVVGTGETHCEPGVRNALRLVALAGESGIPAACGRETPLAGNQVFPDDWRTRADTLNGLDAPEIAAPSPQGDAVELLTTLIRDSADAVTLLTLGPLTNLAEAIQAEPGILENVEQIYIMGGALEVLGNVSFSGIENQVAEWNIFIDPLALRQVLESGAPVTLVPLDATNQAPVDLDFYLQLQANHRTPEAQFVYDLLTAQIDFVASGGYFFWDPLAAAILVDESLGYIKEGKIMVNLKEGTSYGLTRLLSSGFPARYAKAVEAARFENEFLRALNHP